MIKKLNLKGIKERVERKLKLTKTSFKKGAIITACTLSMMALSACGKKDSLLKGTILESAQVITYEDGTKDIVKILEDCRKEKYHHYYSVITGEYIADSSCGKNCTSSKYELNRYEIETVESIVKYLTQEELTKAVESEIKKEDISKIISRVLTDTEEKEKQLVK